MCWHSIEVWVEEQLYSLSLYATKMRLRFDGMGHLGESEARLYPLYSKLLTYSRLQLLFTFGFLRRISEGCRLFSVQTPLKGEYVRKINSTPQLISVQRMGLAWFYLGKVIKTRCLQKKFHASN